MPLTAAFLKKKLLKKNEIISPKEALLFNSDLSLSNANC